MHRTLRKIENGHMILVGTKQVGFCGGALHPAGFFGLGKQQTRHLRKYGRSWLIT